MGWWAGGQVEVESHDRSNLTLPSAQQELVQAVVASIPQDTLLIVVSRGSGGRGLRVPPSQRSPADLLPWCVAHECALQDKNTCRWRGRGGVPSWVDERVQGIRFQMRQHAAA